jgi:predicted acylesterase/phospholipase RssA
MNQKIALVLGSGGARGIAHIGAIRELITPFHGNNNT